MSITVAARVDLSEDDPSEIDSITFIVKTDIGLTIVLPFGGCGEGVPASAKWLALLESPPQFLMVADDDEGGNIMADGTHITFAPRIPREYGHDPDHGVKTVLPVDYCREAIKHVAAEVARAQGA